MSHYDDLAAFSQGPVSSKHLVAIGWLDRAHPFTRGSPRPGFVQTLRRVLDMCWQPYISPGLHSCELCPDERMAGTGTLWIPGDSAVFVSPHLVAHYVEVHDYAPPEQFVSAVMECPEMNSPAYFAKLATFGIIGERPPWAK